ncbi:MAG: hypothetical protein ACRD3J_10955, partial [Thermoanaerobaculia bacterium]
GALPMKSDITRYRQKIVPGVDSSMGEGDQITKLLRIVSFFPNFEFALILIDHRAIRPITAISGAQSARA